MDRALNNVSSDTWITYPGLGTYPGAYPNNAHNLLDLGQMYPVPYPVPAPEWYRVDPATGEWHRDDPETGAIKNRNEQFHDPIMALLISNGFLCVAKLEQEEGEYDLYAAIRGKESCTIRVRLDPKTNLPIFEIEKSVKTKDSHKNRYEIIND